MTTLIVARQRTMYRTFQLGSLAALLCWILAGCNGGAPDLLSAAPASQVQSQGGGSSGNLRLVASLPAPVNTQDGADQLIFPNDVLEVDVFQVDDLDRTVQVDAGGRISVPLVGAVTAAGKSVRTLEAELEQLYGAKYLQSPDITLFVKESAGQKVTVDGEVAKAGLYPVTAGSSLLQVVAQAGGFREVADPTQVYLFRDFGSERLVTNVDVSDIRAGRASDPRVFGGDTVVVFSSARKVAIQNLKDALGVASSAARLAVIP
ncbi:polysaccharide biosynthesis/export family protein [Aurantimonas sp. A2-1-M11]|uniref:polysaccharide biosynthesis/export family protein n=1 Tax=Aurantimonas sp. A2-1-M11 TaxID=3113712 RepID=UPI002F91BFFE